MSLPGVTRRRTDRPWRALVVLVTVLFGWQSISVPAVAQDSGPAPLSEAQLEQLVAPIALYPDSLLAQILMASTYPLEVVEAARWSKQNPKVTGDALEAAMQKQSWDASVKSLTAFPEVLEMMNEKLDLTQQLGDAFLAQQKEVMDAVQRLRQKANSEGNLESNEQQKVIVEQAPAGSSEPTVIQIQPASPQVVYVPSYNPAVVYGSWPYPSYPPYSYYPPGYAWGAAAVSFGVGMAVGAALWGNCNWGYGNVGINVNNYNNFNRTNISNGNWNHNVNHRKGVGYRDRATGQRYGRDSGRRDQSRDSFRGRAEQGRRDIARGGADGFKGDRGRGAQGRGDVGRAGAQGNRGARAGTQSARSDTRGSRSGSGSRSAAQRPSSARGSSAFSGSRGSGAQARQQASRGRTSRQSASAWGGSRGGSGYSRGGGGRSGGSGFSRGGGGGRGGGGRGGGGRRR